MNARFKPVLVVAVSSRALFDFEEENEVFDERNPSAYVALQRQRLDVPAPAGVALPLVRKLLAFNTATQQPLVEVAVLSRNDPFSGLRVFHSARAHGLEAITRGVFTSGREPFAYLRALGAQLFLSANAADVAAALQAGFGAARVFPHVGSAAGAHPHELRMAFDGDAVLFSDQAEQVYQNAGLQAFIEHEVEHAQQPLPAGPLKPFLLALQDLRQATATAAACAPAGAAEMVRPKPMRAPISAPMGLRTALITARSAPAHERVVRTLMQWQLPVDEAMFLGGLDKGAFLREFAPDFFFDDHSGHVSSAAAHQVPAAHVLSMAGR